jgi:hemoglobin-like flavoprotein
MAMKSDAELLLKSLEVIAERHDDIVPLVYQRFYAAYPDTRAMFGRDENSFHQGQMFNGMLLAVIEYSEGRCTTGSIKAWVSDHDALGVGREMFPAMFSAMFDTLRACMGDDWTEDIDGAWKRQIGGLAGQFELAFEQRNKPAVKTA